MSIITVSVKELQDNIEMYLDLIMNGHEIVVNENDKEVGRLIPRDSGSPCLTDSLIGIIKGNYDLDEEKTTSLLTKYDLNDQ